MSKTTTEDPKTTTALLVSALNSPFTLSQVKLSPLQPNEALVEIHSTGLCHTDLSSANGTIPCSFPAILGHEGSGTVKSLSSDTTITHVKPGDKVLLSFYHCQSCEECKAGHPAYCSDFGRGCFSGRRADGSCTATTSEKGEECYASYFGQSSFAQHAVVQTSSMLKVAADTDLATYAPFGCGIQTGAGAVINTLKVPKGASLAVFGVGSVGMAAVMAGKLQGANPIIAVDLNDSRLQLAKDLGATHVLKGDDEKLVDKIKDICSSVGVQYAVDCSGVPAIVAKMVESLRQRGKAAQVGAPKPGSLVNLDIFAHLVGGKEYVGCCEGDSLPSEFIPYLMKEHAAGRFPVEKLIKVYDMKDFQKAIDDTKEGSTLKAVLKW